MRVCLKNRGRRGAILKPGATCAHTVQHKAERDSLLRPRFSELSRKLPDLVTEALVLALPLSLFDWRTAFSTGPLCFSRPSLSLHTGPYQDVGCQRAWKVYKSRATAQRAVVRNERNKRPKRAANRNQRHRQKQQQLDRATRAEDWLRNKTGKNRRGPFAEDRPRDSATRARALMPNQSRKEKWERKSRSKPFFAAFIETRPQRMHAFGLGNTFNRPT